jgi:hypothetical protein
MTRLRDVAELLARALTDGIDGVTATEVEQRGTLVVELFVPAGAFGRVIGRQGRTADALRTLVGLAAQRAGRRVHLEFREGPAPR